MARKTFISYKHSEAQELRNRILEALGEDVTYYQGETADSPDLTDTSTNNIKEKLKDMMFKTSVTIVIVSPKMTESKWIDWEIAYTLKEIPRDGRTSKTNGIVGVVMKFGGSYDWLFSSITKPDGCSFTTIDNSKLYEIIHQNMYNLIGDDKYLCSGCQTVDRLTGSYISLIDEASFLEDPIKYIENAYEKSQALGKYDLTKQV